LRIRVQGQNPLKGTYTPSGNSNEAIALIAASLLTTEEVRLEKMPKTTAVTMLVEHAGEVGTSCVWDNHRLTLRTPKITARKVETALGGSLGAILLLAPVLARREDATLEWSQPIGRLHTHLTALRDLGVKVDIDGSSIHLSARRWGVRQIVLTEASVTATALVCMLAAMLGEKTVVYNAASEPHLRALQDFLSNIGARIVGGGSNLVTVYGAEKGLSGASHTVLPSHTEIASIAAIAAITPGHVNIDPVNPEDLRIINKVYERLGINMIFEDDMLHIPDLGPLRISGREEDVDVAIDTAPWPGFPSDLVAITTVAATQANGTTLIHEQLYNDRLLLVDNLKAMGAQLILADPHRAVVIGPTPLRAEYLDTPDVRLGLALLGAALIAEGEAIIDRAEEIERNFEGVIQKLVKLGAKIEVVDA
jgi:UDP-N-acetylglucosamine 1-carboxyvinyltransferase